MMGISQKIRSGTKIVKHAPIRLPSSGPAYFSRRRDGMSLADPKFVKKLVEFDDAESGADALAPQKSSPSRRKTGFPGNNLNAPAHFQSALGLCQEAVRILGRPSITSSDDKRAGLLEILHNRLADSNLEGFVNHVFDITEAAGFECVVVISTR